MVEKITKDPKAVARGKKSWETQLEKIKKKHLEEIHASDTSNSTSKIVETSSSNSSSDSSNTSSNSTNSSHYYYNFIFLGAIGIVSFFALLYSNQNILKKQQQLESSVPIKKTNPWMD